MIKTRDKVLYLTFDDGPDPGSTPEILDILDRHNIRAVFFCNGRAAEKYPDLAGRIKSKGHITGNHGYNHLNGWITSASKYLDDVNYAAGFTSARIFRPPYGRLRFSQYRAIKKTYRIFMWDIMPYDFDNGIGSNKSLNVLKQKIRPGSIIVLHDKPGSTAPDFLDDFILYAREEKYRFSLPDF